jgi:cholesterol transport system auxiliary component
MTRTYNHMPKLLMLLGFLSGCALTSKADATLPRYFSPELPRKPPLEGNLRFSFELRLGRVTAGSHIREKIVYRQSKYEVGFYDDRLWTERPDAYLRRALGRVLFEEKGLRSAVSGPAPVLDIELVNFEEIRTPAHIALVRLTFSLRDDRAIRFQHTLAVERPIAQVAKTSAPDALAEALGEALARAVLEAAEYVLKDLATGQGRVGQFE